MRSGKRRLISVFLSNRNSLTGVGSGVILMFCAFITFHFFAPIFISKIPIQPNIGEASIIIPAGGVDTTVNSLRDAGFKKTHAFSYDEAITANSEFTTYHNEKGSYGKKTKQEINTTYILFTGLELFKVPQNLPHLPQKPMVIGYTFAQCYDHGFGLLLPTQLEYSMITKDAYERFLDFSYNNLHDKMHPSDAFRVFTDFHSLHLLMMPCDPKIKVMPKWENIPVIEYESRQMIEPWDSIPKIPEVWRIKERTM